MMSLIVAIAPKPLIPTTKTTCFSSFLPPFRTKIGRNTSTTISLSSRQRGSRFVVRAGPPSTNSLLLAFFLPFSLLVGTIFTSIRITDTLDDKYLQEVAMNEAILEEEQVGEDEHDYVDGDGGDYEEEDEVLEVNEGKEEVVKAGEQVVVGTGNSRVRNRPRRQV